MNKIKRLGNQVQQLAQELGASNEEALSLAGQLRDSLREIKSRRKERPKKRIIIRQLSTHSFAVKIAGPCVDPEKEALSAARRVGHAGRAWSIAEMTKEEDAISLMVTAPKSNHKKKGSSSKKASKKELKDKAKRVMSSMSKEEIQAIFQKFNKEVEEK